MALMFKAGGYDVRVSEAYKLVDGDKGQKDAKKVWHPRIEKVGKIIPIMFFEKDMARGVR